MNKKKVGWLIAAIAMIIVGCVLFGGVMMALKWDFVKLRTDQYETNTYEFTNDIQNIKINTDTADIVFLPSDEDACKVICLETANIKHSVRVNDGCLSIQVEDHRKWYQYIGIQFGSPKITVYLPAGVYESVIIREDTGHIEISKSFQFGSLDITASTGDITIESSVADKLQVKTSTGDIKVSDLSAGAIDLTVTTGKVTVSHVSCAGDVNLQVSTGKANVTDLTCHNFTSNGGTGNLMLKNAIAAGKLSVRRSTGSVTFECCDAAEINVKTSTGNVTGSLLSEKVFIYKTSTGAVDLPETVTGGKCDITTSTGSIKISIED